MSTTTVPEVDVYEDPRSRAPLIEGDNDFTSVTDTVCAVVEKPIQKTSTAWFIAFAASLGLLGVFLARIG